MNSDTDDELRKNKSTNGDYLNEWENVTKLNDIFQQIKFTVSLKVT